MKKYLICRTDSIGDLMLATPLIKAVKESAKKAYVAVLAGAAAAEILRGNPAVDEIIIYEKSKEASLRKKIAEGRFDGAITAYPRFSIASLVFFSGVKERYGTAYRWYSPLFFNRPVKMRRSRSEKHEADYNLELGSAITGEARAERVYYYVAEEEKAAAARYISKKGLRSGFIIIHPGSRGSAWNLSPAKYGELAERAAREAGLDILITGGPAEKELVNAVKAAAGSKGIYAMDEDLSLREFGAVISAASCLISSSTGPMHMAAALGVKTLSFFPPRSLPAMSAKRWGPLGNKSAVIEPLETGLSGAAAMDTISIAHVTDRLLLLLKG
ncbi:MAG TPA: glycosyltransferase family 9 protein [bacterium]|nr:glycosyltransferase family 9 protein [bacterium]